MHSIRYHECIVANRPKSQVRLPHGLKTSKTREGNFNTSFLSECVEVQRGEEIHVTTTEVAKNAHKFQTFGLQIYRWCFPTFSIHFLCSPLFLRKITILTKIFQLGASTSRDALFPLPENPRGFTSHLVGCLSWYYQRATFSAFGCWDQCGFDTHSSRGFSCWLSRPGKFQAPTKSGGGGSWCVWCLEKRWHR